jgi:hypothetical protein
MHSPWKAVCKVIQDDFSGGCRAVWRSWTTLGVQHDGIQRGEMRTLAHQGAIWTNDGLARTDGNLEPHLLDVDGVSNELIVRAVGHIRWAIEKSPL